ncbi:MAG TPA: hypothetical protein VEU08_15475 [Vicinamibacterales bacterium]|nr:hypothetical protein [Vicinamibacterales bacterium]
MIDRRHVLESKGVDRAALDAVLAYTNKPDTFHVPETIPAFPLADEPHVAVWADYASQASHAGALHALQAHFAQMRFPIRAGMSQEPAYLDATRKGKRETPEASAPGPPFVRPENLDLRVYETIAGRVPILVSAHRKDFVTLVQAFTERNEPNDVPPSMGACIVNGLNNWDRVAAHRAQWEERHPDEALAGGWGEEFKRMAADKALYQDRFIILSRGPYSAVEAGDVRMNEDDWLAKSLVIRREHECTHYFTYRVFRTMRNNILDELVADFVGLVRAFGGYRGDLARLFLGLEAFPAIRPGSRIEIYRGELSGDALSAVAALAVDATHNLQKLADLRPHLAEDLSTLAQMIYALYRLTLEELAASDLTDSFALAAAQA